MNIKKIGKRIGAILVTFIMVIQSLLTYAAIPSEVSSKNYKEVKVIYKGRETNSIVKEVYKTGQNGGKKFEIKGKAIFYIRAFVYETGSQCKTGVQVTYIDKNNNEVNDWWDYSNALSKEQVGWPECTDYYVEVLDDLEFVEPSTDPDKTVNPTQEMIFSVKERFGGKFKRKTTKEIKLDVGPNFLNIKTEVKDSTNVVKDSYKAVFESDTATKDGVKVLKREYATPLITGLNSKVQVDVDMQNSSLAEAPQYQVKTVPLGTKVELPIKTGTWTSIGTLSGATTKEEITYPDVDEEAGYLSAFHYDVRYGVAKASKDDNILSHDEIFNNANRLTTEKIKQRAIEDSNNQYSSRPEQGAFFDNSKTGVQTMTANFVAPKSGWYWFAIRTSSSAYGTIDGKQFVNEWRSMADQWSAGNYWGGNGWYPKDGDEAKNYYRDSSNTGSNVFYLEEGSVHTIETKWRHATQNDYRPSLQYKMSSDKISWSGWQLADNKVLMDRNFTGAANKAVQYWGYIRPDADGEYNLALYADDGARGWIGVDGKEVYFVDSLKLSDAQNQTLGDVSVSLKGEQDYPFYIEWYEGAPHDKALQPRIKLKSEPESAYRNIPDDWYRASKSEEPTVTLKDVYVSETLSKEIILPNIEGQHYVIVKTKDSYGVENQLLVGPIITVVGTEIIEVPPAGTSNNNNIVPESISNVNAKITYGTDAKKVEYVIDLSNISNVATDNGNKVFKELIQSQLKNAVIEIKDINGKEIIKDGTGNYEKTIVDNKIIIKIKDSNAIIKNGETHEINIYFPTRLNENVAYFKQTGNDNTYMKLLESQSTSPVKVNLTVSRCPKEREALIDPMTGNIILAEQYATTPKVDNVEIQVLLREVPNIH